MAAFFGRKPELKKLHDLWEKRSASMVVVRGRRRIGKSTLIEEFAKGQHFFEFAGIPPAPGITAETQRTAFAKQLLKYFDEVPEKSDWWECFWILAKKTRKGRTIILLDEISWMSLDDPEFLGIIKTVWDTEWKKNPDLILILCGSVSSWIDQNILASTGFVGRISLTLTLEELPLHDCDQFFGQKRHLISAYEKFKLLAVTGGIPRYLEEIRPALPAEENIKNLCFSPEGILFSEFDKIFSDLFNGRYLLYRQIVMSLAEGPKERAVIANQVGLQLGGILSDYLDDLAKAGFITRHPTWRIEDAKESNLLVYRLSDNYLRFYIKYIMPNKNRIELKTFENRSITTLPGFSTIMGLQFENLIFHNRFALRKVLNIRNEDVLMEGPFFQRKTKRQAGCQIDYLIQTQFDTVYVCEIKFTKEKISLGIVEEISHKISQFKRPKFVSCRPVLIHVNGVTSEVEESNYFANIIDFGDLITQE
jgi:AAA+ ATPase superfamily predicted ATPase